MKFKYILIALISLAQAKNIFAQQATDSLLLKKKQLGINFNLLGLSVNYEKRIGKTLTTNYEIGLSYSFYIGGGSISGKHSGYELSPIFSIENRWYYNLYKRMRKGKNSNNNAGNFLSAKVGYRLAPIVSRNLHDNPVIVINPAWGIQRNIGKKINYMIAPGYLFLFDVNQKQWSAHINVSMKIGYLLF